MLRLFLIISLFSANLWAGVCSESLSKISEAEFNPIQKAKAFIKMLYEKGYINKEILSEIATSKKYYDFLQSANNRGLISSQSAFVTFHRTLLFLQDKLNSELWGEVQNYSQELLKDTKQKEQQIVETKKQTANIIIAKTASKVNFLGYDSTQVTLFESGGQLLGIVGASDFPISIFDFYSGKILAEIPESEGVTSPVDIVHDQGKTKAVFFAKKNQSIFISDLSDITKIKSLKMAVGFGAKKILTFKHEDQSYAVLYDLAHQDIHRVELFNITQGLKYKQAHVLSFPKSNTSFKFIKIKSEPFYAYGDELGNVRFYHALTGKQETTISVGKSPLLDIEFQHIDGANYVLVLDQEPRTHLIDLEKTDNVKRVAAKGVSLESYLFEHEGKKFVGLFGLGRREVFEVPSLEYFKSSQQNEELNKSWISNHIHKPFEFQGKTYFVYLVNGNGMVVNGLTEEMILKFSLPPNPNEIEIKQFSDKVVASISTKDDGVVNIILVGQP